MVSKVLEAIEILEGFGVPLGTLTARRRERVAMAFLAVARLRPGDSWASVAPSADPIKTREIIAFWNAFYGQSVSPGSYDDIRRKDLKPLVQSGLVESTGAGRATNDPTRGYVLSESVALLVRQYGNPPFPRRQAEYVDQHGSYADKLCRPRNIAKVDVTLPGGASIALDDSAHNSLQRAVIEEFLPRFTCEPKVLYIGDTSIKQVLVDSEGLAAAGLPEPDHEKLPDIVVYDPVQDWLYFIEAVHSANPVSPERHLDLAQNASNAKAPIVYVSVFADRTALRQWIAEIAWETEVWLADAPDHIIHFNGDRFMGPHL